MKNVFLAVERKDFSLNNIITTVTFLVIVAGLVFPAGIVEHLITPAAILLLLAGIPHGASDFIIFQNINDGKNRLLQVAQFALIYAVIAISYTLLWWYAPFVAFAFFILNSIYHFGESKWSYLYDRNAKWASAISWTWGSAVLLVPVLIHQVESATIIREMTGYDFGLTSSVVASIVFLSCGLNLLLMTLLFEQGWLSESEFYREMGHFILLIILFLCTPLLIGFGIYFLLWHSTYAMKDHFECLELNQHPTRRKEYFRQLTFFSTIAMVGLGMIYYLFGNEMNLGPNLGKLFVFIAVITVPHSLLMHQLYQFKIFREKRKLS